MSLADSPDISIHNFEKNEHDARINSVYANMWIGSDNISANVLGGEM